MAALSSCRFLFSSAFAFSLSILCLSSISLSQAQKGGFSLELIHRDSPKSPFFNPKETPYKRVTDAMRRSFDHVSRFNRTLSSLDTAEADIIPNQGDYLMKLSIGTPPFEILAVADTGSDLIWTQCKPCSQCFEEEAPLFDPSKSSTYNDIACSSGQCKSLDRTSCSTEQTCKYSYPYGDESHGSFSNGDLAIDTITLDSTSGRPVILPKAIIGCGRNNSGPFNNKTSGIVGLGGGNVSLIRQLGDSIGGKFSYCLIPVLLSSDDTSSKINFGSNGVVSGSGVVSTPLITKDPNTFYFLTLEAISVGTTRIPFDGSSGGTTDGNIIIDSGTTLTLLPQDFNSKLVSAVSSLIDAKPVEDTSGLSLDLCYSASSEIDFPSITVHFTGADVELSSYHTFIGTKEEDVCFTFKGINDSQGLTIYGNLVQTNFLVGYDIEKKTVSFKPTDCTKE